MNRGSLSSSSSDAGPVEVPRRGSAGQMESSPRVSRSSVLPSVVFPYLRRLDTGEATPRPLKDPLLVLRLSSPSFLDSEIKDNISRHPLYTIRTNGTQTTVVRSDPWNGETKTAAIEWPVLDPSKGKGKQLDGVTIQMRSGRPKSADTFLRPGSILSAPRKFKIPGYSHSLKWKAVGSSYWCLAASAKGPIAILEPATAETAPPVLKVFETLHDKYETRPMLVHQGVSIILLDYLLVSSLLMTTDIQEWMVVQRYDVQEEGRCTPEVSGCDDNGPRSAPPASTSALQWRKIIYGEPLFPKRQSSASTTSHPRFPTHASRMAKIFNGEPIYPTLTRGSRASSPDFFSISSDSESDGETTAGDTVRPPSTPSRAPSPSAESVLYPLTTASAPAHPYLDPSFYNASAIPPVPPLPAEYASSARPASASGTRRPRELPRPPQHSTTHRSRSSPPRPIPIETNYSMPAGTQSASSSPDRRRPSVDTILSRSGSMRVLPRPPPTPTEASSSHPPLRHSQSSSRPLNSRTRDKRSSQYNPRTLPQTPTAMSHPDWMTGLQIRKRSHNEFYQWFPNANQPLPSNNAVDDQRPESIFEALDCPPPAYNSAEYAAGTSLSVSPHSPPTLPSLIRPSTAGP